MTTAAIRRRAAMLLLVLALAASLGGPSLATNPNTSDAHQASMSRFDALWKFARLIKRIAELIAAIEAFKTFADDLLDLALRLIEMLKGNPTPDSLRPLSEMIERKLAEIEARLSVPGLKASAERLGELRFAIASAKASLTYATAETCGEFKYRRGAICIDVRRKR